MVNSPAMAVPLASRLAVAAPPTGSSERRQPGWTVVAAATSAVGTLHEPASEPLARYDAAPSCTSVVTMASSTRSSAGGDVGPATYAPRYARYAPRYPLEMPEVGHVVRFLHASRLDFAHRIYSDFPNGRRLGPDEVFFDFKKAVVVDDVRASVRGGDTYVAVSFWTPCRRYVWTNWSKNEAQWMYLSPYVGCQPAGKC